MSDVYQSLAHSKWDCKYHVVFVPKRRRKAIFGPIRSQLGAIFHALAKQQECQTRGPVALRYRREQRRSIMEHFAPPITPAC
jgi:REP element-mobilizing transposase RayT